MFLLDTCAFLWQLSGPAEIVAEARTRLDAADRLGVSLASVWEIAIKVQVGKLRLDLPVEDWIRRSLLYPRIELLPLTPLLVVASTQLPGTFHKDPFDRVIVATAIRDNLTLVTRDERMLSYPNVKSMAC
jgi:PIN domain nuclease of toxin-antitoxin system